MENNENIKASFKGLIPFIVFILLYLGTGIFLNIKGVELAFYQLPGPVAAFAGIIVAFIIFKGTIQEKFNTFLEGCGHPDIITMCIIYLLAGAFAVVSKAMGGVDSTVNLGITYIPPHYIAVGLGEKSGVPMALILAAVMGGAMFGDNLSVISDTTIAATKTQGVEMKDKFRINLYIALPAAILTIILLFLFARPDVVPEAMNYDYNLVKVFPYIFVLVMALAGVNVFVVLTSGILLSGIIGFIYGDFTLLGYGKEIYNGFTNMTEIFVLSLLTGGMAQMVTRQGGIQWVIDTVQKFIVGKKSAKVGIGLLVSLADIAVANNTVAIIITGGISKKISEKNNVDLRESAAILDIFSCIFQGLIPYGAQMLILLGFAGDKVAPTQLIPLLWYQLLLGIFTLIYIFIPQISRKALSILDKNVEKK